MDAGGMLLNPLRDESLLFPLDGGSEFTRTEHDAFGRHGINAFPLRRYDKRCDRCHIAFAAGGRCCLHRSELRCPSGFFSPRFARKLVPTAEMPCEIVVPVTGTLIARGTAPGATVHL